MKSFLLACSLLLMLTAAAQRVEFPKAKFATGDNIAYSYPSYDDSKWADVKTNTSWELQGFPDYNGFAWYRIHMFIPPSLKEHSLWKDSLRLFMAKVDDACEVYLNGVRIGKSGSFPDEPGGYQTTWNKWLEFHIAANAGYLNWGGENILSVRAYDGDGPGGMFGGTPYASMIDLVDNISIDNHEAVQYSQIEKAVKRITLKNNYREKISGTFSYTILNTEDDKEDKHSFPVNLAPNTGISYTIPLSLAKRNIIRYQFTEAKSNKEQSLTEYAPYILTPEPPATPRINGAQKFGVRPGSPFLYKIPATGKKPLQYSVLGLPEGLQVNAATGIITGVLKKAGDYTMSFVVKNALGTDKRSFTVRCGDLIALTPPMGWNSWNCWGLSINDERLKASARAMIDKGLVDHGWSYINIDDGWEAAQRNDDGTISTNKKFPDLKKTGDWLHQNGLKFGIYSSPGPKTCGDFLGSYQHELQDATTYARWGIDYLKYDWCSYERIHDAKDSSLESYQLPYKIMQEALSKQPRDIVYSLCQYGMKDVWTWGASVNGNSWRTTGDIEDSWESMSGIGFSQYTHHPYAQPGHWNDPDMMVVGLLGWGDHHHPTRLTPDEQYTHVSLWCMLNAPLLIGCDLSKLDKFTLNLLTNDEVLAVNQDPLGRQAQLPLKGDNYQVWIKDMADGSKVIGIFNLADKEDVVRFYWNNLALEDTYKVRDLWRQADIGTYKSMFATKLAPHGVTLIKITKP